MRFFMFAYPLTGYIGYLKGFDVKELSKYVDYLNFMSYDIYGTWDGNSEWTKPVVNPHTNLTGKLLHLCRLV